jgi:hypothetical protein
MDNFKIKNKKIFEAGGKREAGGDKLTFFLWGLSVEGHQVTLSSSLHYYVFSDFRFVINMHKIFEDIIDEHSSPCARLE